MWVKNEGIQKRLLTEAEVTLARAVEVAQGREAAQVYANLMKGKPSEAASISKVTREHKPESSTALEETLLSLWKTGACP